MVELGILTLILLTSILLAGLLLKARPVEYVTSPVKIKLPVKPENIKPKTSSDRFIQTMSATFAHLQIGIAVLTGKTNFHCLTLPLASIWDCAPNGC